MELAEYMRELILMRNQYGQEEELYPLINMLLRENGKVEDLSIRDVHNHVSKGPRKDMLYGYAGFPDLEILDENYDIEKYDQLFEKGKRSGVGVGESEMEELFNLMYGCVEAKALHTELFNIEAGEHILNIEVENTDHIMDGDEFTEIENRGILQLRGELLWYGKVLYTNGLVWKYLEIDKEIRNKLFKECFVGKGDWKKMLASEEGGIQISCIEIANLPDVFEEIKSSKLEEVQNVIELDKNENLRKEWKRLKKYLSYIDWKKSKNQFHS